MSPEIIGEDISSGMKGFLEVDEGVESMEVVPKVEEEAVESAPDHNFVRVPEV